MAHSPDSAQPTPQKAGCLVYTRVSTDRQAEEGYSLREQEASCRRLAEQRGYQVLGVYREEGASGTTTNRPQFQAMLDRCSEDRRVKAVIVIHTDRFARNTLEHLTVKAVLRKHGVALLSALQPMLDDSPEGGLLDIVLAGVNEFYSKDLGRKTAKGMRQKLEEGWWPGWAPLGYVNVTNPATKQHTVAPDPERAPYITMAFDRFRTGRYSVEQLLEELHAEGFRSRSGGRVAKSITTNLLRNPFYMGKMRYRGAVYPGKHEPLTDMDTFLQVQEVLAKHNHGANRARKHRFLLSSLLFCDECGAQLSGERHAKRSGLVFDYYRCLGPKHRAKGCRQPLAPAKTIEAAIPEWLRGVELSPQYTNAFRVALEEVAAAQRRLDQRQVKALENRRVGIERRMARLEDLYVSGFLHQQRLAEKYQPLKEELRQVELVLAQARDPRARLLHRDIDEILAFVQNFAQMHQSFNPARQRQFLDAVVEKAWVRDRQIARIDYAEPFRAFLEKDLVRIRTNWLPIRDLIRTLMGRHEADFDRADVAA
jgi:DNA invertase Pin-like site-specific DNA recombinase